LDKGVIMRENFIPKAWYDLRADLNIQLEPLVFERDNSSIYTDELLKGSDHAYVKIPEPVLELYAEYRPTPLRRAYSFEKSINSYCKIYYKYEGDNPVGSHKINTAIPQAYFAQKNGFNSMTTATGAGQWGSAIAFASHKFCLKSTIFFVNISLKQKPYRKVLMEMLGAQVISSPSTVTSIGKLNSTDPKKKNGNMGLATSEAVEYAITQKATFGETSHAYGVILHQTVIGLESIKQMEMFDDFPDIVIGCVGGGTNFGGISIPFLKYKIAEKHNIRFIAVEPKANSTLLHGDYKYDYADSGKLTPMIKMYTLGHTHTPDPIHAGGLRYHGFDPLLSKLYHDGHIEAQAYDQREIFAAGISFYKSEGIVPAPESSHAIRSTIEEAQKKDNKNKSILFCLSGHGYFDLSGYDFYMKNLHYDKN